MVFTEGIYLRTLRYTYIIHIMHCIVHTTLCMANLFFGSPCSFPNTSVPWSHGSNLERGSLTLTSKTDVEADLYTSEHRRCIYIHTTHMKKYIVPLTSIISHANSGSKIHTALQSATTLNGDWVSSLSCVYPSCSTYVPLLYTPYFYITDIIH